MAVRCLVTCLRVASCRAPFFFAVCTALLATCVGARGQCFTMLHKAMDERCIPRRRRYDGLSMASPNKATMVKCRDCIVKWYLSDGARVHWSSTCPLRPLMASSGDGSGSSKSGSFQALNRFKCKILTAVQRIFVGGLIVNCMWLGHGSSRDTVASREPRLARVDWCPAGVTDKPRSTTTQPHHDPSVLDTRLYPSGAAESACHPLCPSIAQSRTRERTGLRQHGEESSNVHGVDAEW